MPSAHNIRSSADSHFHGLIATSNTVVDGLKGKKTQPGFLTHFNGFRHEPGSALSPLLPPVASSWHQHPSKAALPGDGSPALQEQELQQLRRVPIPAACSTGEGEWRGQVPWASSVKLSKLVFVVNWGYWKMGCSLAGVKRHRAERAGHSVWSAAARWKSWYRCCGWGAQPRASQNPSSLLLCAHSIHLPHERLLEGGRWCEESRYSLFLVPLSPSRKMLDCFPFPEAPLGHGRQIAGWFTGSWTARTPPTVPQGSRREGSPDLTTKLDESWLDQAS